MKVFVYGTLKSGGSLFLKEHAMNIKRATAKGKLYGGIFAWFPFADFNEEGIIVGEVQEFDKEMLKVLDQIELGAGYKRILIETLEGDECWAYHHPSINKVVFTEIEGGEWNVNQ